MAFEPITINTQDELDKMFAERAERARKAEAEKYKGFDEYKAKADKYDVDIAAKDEVIAAKDKDIADFKAKVAAFERDALKSKVAAEFGLAPELAGRLNGETEDDLKKDAQALQSIVGAKTAPLANPEPDRQDADDGYRAIVKGIRKNHGGN